MKGLVFDETTDCPVYLSSHKGIARSTISASSSEGFVQEFADLLRKGHAASLPAAWPFLNRMEFQPRAESGIALTVRGRTSAAPGRRDPVGGVLFRGASAQLFNVAVGVLADAATMR
mgnify:CR=1 FL=1